MGSLIYVIYMLHWKGTQAEKKNVSDYSQAIPNYVQRSMTVFIICQSILYDKSQAVHGRFCSWRARTWVLLGMCQICIWLQSNPSPHSRHRKEQGVLEWLLSSKNQEIKNTVPSKLGARHSWNDCRCRDWHKALQNAPRGSQENSDINVTFGNLVCWSHGS